MNFPTADDADRAWRAKQEAVAMSNLAAVIYSAMADGYDPDTPLALDKNKDWSALSYYTLDKHGWVLDTVNWTIKGKAAK